MTHLVLPSFSPGTHMLLLWPSLLWLQSDWKGQQTFFFPLTILPPRARRCVPCHSYMNIKHDSEYLWKNLRICLVWSNSSFFFAALRMQRPFGALEDGLKDETFLSLCAIFWAFVTLPHLLFALRMFAWPFLAFQHPFQPDWVDIRLKK